MATISVTNIADGDAVTAASINNQVNTIVNDYNGNITAANLASNAVTSAKITNANVTPDKLGTGASTAAVATSETTANTTYVALATAGPAVTVTIGANGIALVNVRSFISNNTQGKRNFMGFDISGATTVSASDAFACEWQAWIANADATMNDTFLVTGLAAGSTTFTAKYRVDANTGTFSTRKITVVPL